MKIDLILEKLKPYFVKYFRRRPVYDKIQQLESEMAKGSRIKAMVDSGGFNDYCDEFVELFMNDFMRLAIDIESGSVNRETLDLRVAQLTGRFKNFEFLKRRIEAYEFDRTHYEENKKEAEKFEQIRQKQAEYAR